MQVFALGFKMKAVCELLYNPVVQTIVQKHRIMCFVVRFNPGLESGFGCYVPLDA